MIGSSRRPRGLLIAIIVSVVALVTSIVGFAVIAGASNNPTPIVASDTMNRTVTNGLGKANVGGPYAVSAPKQTSVKGGAAHLVNIAPGTGINATLNAVHVANVGVEATIAPGALTYSASGAYFDLLLRHQANGDTYRAKARLLPNGKVSVGLSRVHANHEVFLGQEVELPLTLTYGQSLVIQADAVGSKSVSLDVRAWIAGQNVPSSWQSSATDSSAARIAGAGAVGVFAYLSRVAVAPISFGITHFIAWTGQTGTPPAGSPGSTSPGHGTGSGSGSSSGAPSHSSSPSSSSSGGTPSSSPSSSSASPTPTKSSSSPAPSSGSSTHPPVVTPPATAGPAGSLAPGSAKYAIPAGAVFVSPGGSGAGKGTQSSPYTSLAGAIATARSGSTLVLRGGTYHENVTVPSYKSLTIQSYPGEAVWLDGSSQVSSWTQSGRTWIHTGWTARFSSEPTYTPGSIPSGKAWQFVNPAYPMAAHPDQVWIDGAALTQVGSAAAVGPGEFYADYANKRLVIGSSPSGHDVQASDLDLAITVNSPNSHVRGIGVLDYATPVDEFGTVQLNGSGDSIENVVIMNSATAGLTVSAPNVTVRQVTIQGCGMLGVHAVYADNFTVIGLLAQNNNTEHFNQAPVSGGVKITRSRVVTIENGVFRNNLGPGVWVDESSYDLTLVGNRITGNTGHGVAYEISSVGILANNVVQNNGGDGFKINDSDHVQLWNNLISGNGQNVLIAEDQRRGSNPGIPGHDPRQHTPESWLILDDSLMNNVIGTAGGYPAYIRDYSGQYSMAQLNMQVNGNQFTRTGSVEMVWGLANHGVATFTSMAQFTAATGQGGHNIDPVGGSSPAAVAAAAASAAPLPLPADVAAAIGQPAGIEHRGAFLQ